MKLILMQGVPGSGKSTVAASLGHPIFSTDRFWIGENSEYQFNPARLSEAHAWNQACAEAYMMGGGENLIIDNTNIKRTHVQPYLDLAKKHGYEVEVVRVECDPKVAYERGTHGVPLEVVERMAREMEDLL